MYTEKEFTEKLTESLLDILNLNINKKYLSNYINSFIKDNNYYINKHITEEDFKNDRYA